MGESEQQNRRLRPEEEGAGALLKRALEAEYGFRSVHFSPGPDPPDLVASVVTPAGAPQRWGVEVTRLQQEFEEGGKARNRNDVQGFVGRICDELENELGARLCHDYSLLIKGQIPDPVARDLKRRIRDYILSGQSKPAWLDYQEECQRVASLFNAPLDDPNVRETFGRMINEDGMTVRICRHSVEGGEGRKISRIWLDSADSTVPGTRAPASNLDVSLDFDLNKIFSEKLGPALSRWPAFDKKVLFVLGDRLDADPDDVREAILRANPKGIDAIFYVPFLEEEASLVADFGLFEVDSSQM